MDFSEALKLALEGKQIAREGWNGKGQMVFRQNGQKIASALSYGFGEYPGEPTVVDVLVLHTTKNDLIVGWTPSTGDLFAKDWVVV